VLRVHRWCGPVRIAAIKEKANANAPTRSHL
jgi:hypothetical protein